MSKEKDMIVDHSKMSQEDTADQEMTPEEIQGNIDTAITVWGVLDGMDLQSPDILSWGMKHEVLQAKQDCLTIMITGIAQLKALHFSE